MTSTIKSNTVTNATASTLTLGESGTTVTLACGATQSGFGRTGTVNWCTTAKTSPFTAATGKGYFINTCGGTVTVTLPASPSAGDIVAIQDLNRKFGTNKVTLCRNSSKIKGACANHDLDKDGQATTIVYSGGTQGWVAVGDANVTCGSALSREYNVQYLVVAGGGAGAPAKNAGVGVSGGGAGGYRTIASKTFTVSGGNAYTITVGGGAVGGSGCNAAGASGSNSVFSTITSAGGGGAGVTGPVSGPTASTVGIAGGSGGGGGTCTSSATNGKAGGAGNTPPVSPSQGNNGGTGTTRGAPPFGVGGGGGGAGAVGANGGPGTGAGGAGSASTIFGSSPIAPSYGVAPNPSNTGPGQYFAGGGGGGWGGSSDGGYGGGAGAPSSSQQAGTTNTGGGGSGDSTPSPYGAGGAGGSGIVVIRHATANGGSGGNATGTCGADTIRVFTGDGTFTA